jgi:hypothetical protein
VDLVVQQNRATLKRKAFNQPQAKTYFFKRFTFSLQCNNIRLTSH